MPNEVEPFVAWRDEHPCPRCGRSVVYAGNGRPARFCSATCRRRAAAVREAEHQGLVSRELVVVRSVPDVAVLNAGEQLTLLHELLGKVEVERLTSAQVERLDEALWRLHRACRDRLECPSVVAGRGPRMLPGFGPR